jgi:hypothetical protein
MTIKFHSTLVVVSESSSRLLLPDITVQFLKSTIEIHHPLSLSSGSFGFVCIQPRGAMQAFLSFDSLH